MSGKRTRLDPVVKTHVEFSIPLHQVTYKKALEDGCSSFTDLLHRLLVLYAECEPGLIRLVPRSLPNGLQRIPISIRHVENAKIPRVNSQKSPGGALNPFEA